MKIPSTSEKKGEGRGVERRARISDSVRFFFFFLLSVLTTSVLAHLSVLGLEVGRENRRGRACKKKEEKKGFYYSTCETVTLFTATFHQYIGNARVCLASLEGCGRLFLFSPGK